MHTAEMVSWLDSLKYMKQLRSLYQQKSARIYYICCITLPYPETREEDDCTTNCARGFIGCMWPMNPI